MLARFANLLALLFHNVWFLSLAWLEMCIVEPEIANTPWTWLLNAAVYLAWYFSCIKGQRRSEAHVVEKENAVQLSNFEVFS